MIFSTNSVGVIVEDSLEHAPGLEFTNQAGCLACEHPRTRGVFIPVNINSEFFGCAFSSGAQDFSDHEMQLRADAFDRELACLPDFDLDVTVDRSRLNEAMEAWVPVIGKVQSLRFKRGVLVWNNCD